MTRFALRPYRLATTLLLSGALAACATTPPPKTTEAEATPTLRENPRPPLPNQALTPQFLYEMLLGEIAAQRGNRAVATRAYLDLMQNTEDYRVAERAAQIALNARYFDEAYVAAQRWLQLEPTSVDARQMLAGILITRGKLDEAEPHLKKILGAESTNVGFGFLHLNNLLARHPDKAAVLRLVQRLAQDYPQLPEAHFAIARAAWAANEKALSMREIDTALSLRPQWDGAALFKVQILQAESPAAALEFYTRYLHDYPQAREMRLAYARLLVQEKRFPAAREEFKRLLADFPTNPEVPLAVGLLSMQLRDYDAAETYFRRALDGGIQDSDAVRFYLGQLSEERKRWDEARQWYSSVSGEQAFTARLRIAAMLAHAGKLPEARAYLQGLPVSTNQERAQAAAAEASLLRDNKQYQEAFDVLGKALEKLPNYPDLLYDYAMAAEKLGRLDVMESSLKKLIQIKPEYAHAYNALGYTLADRTTRFDEAKNYLDQALKLAPEDAFILDSMGWLQYRMKNYAEAIATLRRALSLRADPEIAAHLGEVLWVSGDKTEAQKVWSTALKESPDNEALGAAVAKFKGR